MLLNSASARLLSLMQDNPGSTGREVVTLLAQEMALSPDTLFGFAQNLMRDFLAQGAILGVRA